MTSDGPSDGASQGRGVAPAFNTGGGGFEFENLVCAWAAAGLASGASPLGVEIGVPRELRFQASASGWALDDLVITGDAHKKPRWSVSVKSFDMLVGSKLPGEFVETAWREILEGPFRFGHDRVGLVCGSAAEGNWNALLKLIRDAQADPEGMPSRIDVKGAFNPAERSIWKSCECPEELATRHSVAVKASPARLLASLLPRRLDLLEPGSQTLAQALGWCRSALTPEQASNEQDLWEALCAVVSDLRPKGGALGWELIASRLGSRFAFRLRPDIEPDWRLIHEHTETALSGIRDQLGNGITLPRTEAWASLHSLPASDQVILLFGPSGCGKTALAKRWLTDGDHQRLWLSSADLDGGIAGVRTRLGLRRSLPDLLTLAPGLVRVVIDGLDRSYVREHFAATASLARTAAIYDGRIQVLITSQQMELPRVSRELMQVNAPPATTVPMQDLDDADVRLVLGDQPQLARVAVAGRLENVLRRPKLLDLVLRASGSSKEVLQRITDEAAVADLWWQHFVLGGQSPATRQELLLQLATKQADQLLPWTPAGEFPPADVERADQLRLDGVLDENRARYAFAHDLFTDWTLLQRLRALGDGALRQLSSKAELPTWHRAIRLHALTVLREEGVEAWAWQRARLDANDQQLVADLFLDAALFSDDTAALLRSLWPTLVADNGALLRRLLRRFLHVATVPDPRGALIFSDAPELEAHWATQARMPLWPLWLPILEVLYTERDTAIDAALSQVASVADLWLRHAKPGWPLRDHAAHIALAIGRLVLNKMEEDWLFDDKLEAALWRTTLAAGAVDPQSVLDLIGPALEPNSESQEPVGVSQRRWYRVDRQRLRAAILDGDAVVPLIGADPSIASRLVQRAAIDPETQSHLAILDEDGLGITDAPDWFTPFPERGPFQALLLSAPDDGLECILSLVEHATERWTDEGTSVPGTALFESGITPDPFEVVIDGDPVELIGDDEVMHWYRGEGRVPSVLSSAMMALESYLYRQLDAGEDISLILDRLKQSRSLAVWGLLVEIARFRPTLLHGPLAPVVSSAAILFFDKLYTPHDRSYVMPVLSDRAFAERIHAWNTMPHRKQPVINFVMSDVLNGVALVEELAAARHRWEELDADRWTHLIAQTDPANHHLTELEDGFPVAEYLPPPELEPEIGEGIQKLVNSQFSLMFPYRLREWIDEGTRPSDDELQKFWSTTQERLAQPTGEFPFANHVRSQADLECGLAALFVTCAPDWLLAHPDRDAWCRRILLAPFQGLQPSHHLDFSAGELSTERWDVFCADALPALWARAPGDTDLRYAIAQLATNSRRLTVSRTFNRVAQQPELAEDLHRLEHLSLHWARFLSWQRELRHREENARHGFGAGPRLDALPDVETPTRTALNDFVRGTLPVVEPRLRQWIAATPEGMLGPAMSPRRRSLAVLDLSYLLAARSHLTSPLTEVRADKRQRWVEFAADLAELIASGLVPRARDRVEGTPYAEERSAFRLLARLTIQSTLEEARTIWQPILAVGGPAHYWVEDYLHNIWHAALAPDRWPSAFPVLLKEMLAFASETDTWRGPPEVDLALAIVGLDQSGYSRMEARHMELVKKLLPEWADWVRPRLQDTWFARRAVRFFDTPAAEPVRPDALAWLADCERLASRSDSDLDQAIAELLLSISVKEPELLRGPGKSAADARYLLSRLTGRGTPLAVVLSARLG